MKESLIALLRYVNVAHLNIVVACKGRDRVEIDPVLLRVFYG